MKLLLVLPPYNESSARRFGEIAGHNYEVLWVSPREHSAKYHAALKQAEIIIGYVKPLDYALCQNLKFAQHPWAGVEDILEGGSFPKNAVFCNMSGCFGRMIAEYAVGVTLSISRLLPNYYEAQKNNSWSFLDYDKPLECCHLLVLGSGNLGSCIAHAFRPLVKKITGVCRTARACPQEFDRLITLSEAESVLNDVDIVICCLPSTEETQGWFNEPRLRRMKKDAILVNVGRGDLIPEYDLTQVLKDNYFRGVALDVTNPMPLPKSSPLWNMKNVLITPHISGNYIKPGSPTWERQEQIAENNLRRYLNGEPLKNIVNFSTGYANRNL